MDEPLEKALEIIKQTIDPDKVILFGSRARKEGHLNSDYDFGQMSEEKIKQRIKKLENLKRYYTKKIQDLGFNE